MSGDEFAGRVGSLKPDLLGVSAMSPTWLPIAERLARLREVRSEIPVLVGGYQAILNPEETINHAGVNFVCVGEGEIPLVRLISRLQGIGPEGQAIPGLWEKQDGGRVIRTEPVLTPELSPDNLPDYSIFARHYGLRHWCQYGVESTRLLNLPVITGRGCPYRCSYCNNTSLLQIYQGKGRYLRKYDPERLVSELVQLRDQYAVEYFQFWDEMFLYDLGYARRLLDDYRRRVRLPFSMFAHVEKMEADFCRSAALAGCHSMWFGVESGSEEYRRRYLYRTMSNQQIRAASENARQAGIKRMIFNMFGMPFETREDMVSTLELTKEIDPERAVFIQYLPLPGTPLYRLAQESDLLLEQSSERQMWELGHLNVRQHPGAATSQDVREMAAWVADYNAKHNRLDY